MAHLQKPRNMQNLSYTPDIEKTGKIEERN